MIKIKKSPLLLTLYNGIYALIILVYIFVSCMVLLYNSFYNEQFDKKTGDGTSNGTSNETNDETSNGTNKQNYIYGNNKKLIIMFIINFIVGLSLVIKGIIFMKAQCSEREYYRKLKECIDF
ncbi:hypothetical protein Hokovirus_3_218 [Hokovirus HKV1]|uniref:Uncharacterized protein n=1 Tax=Hokovirus HKV1 TaxID=1977638 RepID=A0A1V0SGU5_9VIRU|nr:hypothetical protein Hokovirus_3_218 [Hokovirus HKV1]